MLRKAQQNSKVLSIVVSAPVSLCSNILLVTIEGTQHAVVLLVTTELNQQAVAKQRTSAE
jgi:hypothetical protein